MRPIAVTDYQQLLDALRFRQVELNVSRETIDEIAGLPQRYTSKLLAPVPIKGVGRVSLGPLLGALGLKLVVVEDPEQLDRVRSRLVPRSEADLKRIEANRLARLRKSEKAQESISGMPR